MRYSMIVSEKHLERALVYSSLALRCHPRRDLRELSSSPAGLAPTVPSSRLVQLGAWKPRSLRDCAGGGVPGRARSVKGRMRLASVPGWHFLSAPTVLAQDAQ